MRGRQEQGYCGGWAWLRIELAGEASLVYPLSLLQVLDRLSFHQGSINFGLKQMSWDIWGQSSHFVTTPTTPCTYMLGSSHIWWGGGIVYLGPQPHTRAERPLIMGPPWLLLHPASCLFTFVSVSGDDRIAQLYNQQSVHSCFLLLWVWLLSTLCCRAGVLALIDASLQGQKWAIFCDTGEGASGHHGSLAFGGSKWSSLVYKRCLLHYHWAAFSFKQLR